MAGWRLRFFRERPWNGDGGRGKVPPRRSRASPAAWRRQSRTHSGAAANGPHTGVRRTMCRGHNASLLLSRNACIRMLAPPLLALPPSTTVPYRSMTMDECGGGGSPWAGRIPRAAHSPALGAAGMAHVGLRRSARRCGAGGPQKTDRGTRSLRLRVGHLLPLLILSIPFILSKCISSPACHAGFGGLSRSAG